jgi:hypothetical protein
MIFEEPAPRYIHIPSDRGYMDRFPLHRDEIAGFEVDVIMVSVSNKKNSPRQLYEYIDAGPYLGFLSLAGFVFAGRAFDEHGEFVFVKEHRDEDFHGLPIAVTDRSR